jgi:hypothetical protein
VQYNFKRAIEGDNDHDGIVPGPVCRVTCAETARPGRLYKEPRTLAVVRTW